MNHKNAIGVDIGGTHITCAAVNIQEGLLMEDTLSRSEYDHNATAEVVFKSWAAALNLTLSKMDTEQLAGIGIAIPGPFDYRNGISKMQHKFKNLFDLNIPATLNPLLVTKHDLTIRFLNDAASFAVGEAWRGEGMGFQRVVVITLGTGFGSAFIKGGVPVVTGETVPDEGCLWHLPFKKGIADDYFSTRWFMGEYEKQTGQKITGVKELMKKVTTDVDAQHLFTQFGQNLAACLTAPLRNFDAEVLVIGGNIAHALPHFGPSLREELQKAGIAIQIKSSRLMENAALLGSARLLDEVFWQQVSEHLPHI